MRGVSSTGIAIGALVAAGMVLGAGRWGATVTDDAPDAPPPELAADRRAVTAYDEALQPLLGDGGQVVAQGLKPGVADVAEGALDDEVLARMANGWVASLRDVTADVAALPAPPPLEEVSVRYERALRTYVRAAEALAAATRATGDERAGLVEAAAAFGRTADRLFDEAEAAMSAHRTWVADPTDLRGTR